MFIFQQIAPFDSHFLYLQILSMAMLGSWLLLLLVKGDIVCYSIVTVSLSQRLWHGGRAFGHLEHSKPVLAVAVTCLHTEHLAECMISSGTRNSETVHMSQCLFLHYFQTCLVCEVNQHHFPPVDLHQNLSIWSKGTGASETTLYVELLGYVSFVGLLISGETGDLYYVPVFPNCSFSFPI